MAESTKWFHIIHKVTLPERLDWIANIYGGFQNAGPIFYYPPNTDFFKRRPPTSLLIGDWFYIPWRRDLLQKTIATCEYTKLRAIEQANKLIEKQMKSEEELMHTLHVVDAVGWLATMGVSIGGLAVHGAKVAAAPIASRAVEEAPEHLVKWFLVERVATGLHIMAHAIHAPQKPQKDFGYYARHVFGVITPSWWTSLMVQASAADRDWEVFKYGPKILTYRNALKIKARAEEEIKKLDLVIRSMKAQAAMRFYEASLSI